MSEIWRCAASLERLAAEVKVQLGQTLVGELSRPSLGNHVLWCLGRLGARSPLYGPANTVVPRETAERWVSALLDRPFAEGREAADAVFALTQLARVSGDRVRDLDPDLRLRVIDRLRALGADPEAVPSSNTTSARPPSRARRSATPCPSGSGCWERRRRERVFRYHDS